MRERCSLDGASRGAMLAISLGAESEQTADLLPDLLQDSCQVAFVKGPSPVIVSGLAAQLANLQAELRTNKTGATMLLVPFGFHFSQTDAIVDVFSTSAATVHIGKPACVLALETQTRKTQIFDY
ncbi:hypothetical protein INS49_010571 [Diaporthe citri]|uniref:uncharacterized protein n=1 Tax=Diaporthe citri TaxID=83186 RepID=UPI001C7E8D42|nr:uncharacterized protein INS49_010571 [Diaporthe citri]KAG6362341.1 hypothetical protein INS49_010571 [Diaporthe citri]